MARAQWAATVAGGSVGPSPAKCLVERDHARRLVALRLDQIQFRLEELTLRIQDFEVTGHPALVSHVGDLAGVRESLDEQFLLLPEFLPFTDADQCIRHFAQRLLQGLLVVQPRLLGHGLVEVDVGLQAAHVEDGQGDGRQGAEYPERPEVRAVDRRAADSGKSGYRDLRIEQCRGDADLRVRGNQLLLGLLNVRPPQEEVQRQARGQRRGGDLLVEWTPALDRARILSEQDADEVLLLLDLALDVRDRFRRAIEQRLGLPQIEHAGHAAVQPGLHEVDGLDPGVHGPPGDFQREVQRPEGQISVGDLSDQRGHDHVTGFVGGEQVGPRGLRVPAKLAPEIQLPCDIESGLRLEAVVGKRGRAVRARVCGIRGADAAVHRREFLRPGDRDLALRLQNARHGNAQVVVLRQGRADQRLEVRVRKDAPPFEIAERRRGGDRRLGIGPAIDRRNRELGTLVVGTDHAAGGKASGCAEQGNLSGSHVNRLLARWARPAAGAVFAPCRRRPSPSTKV